MLAELGTNFLTGLIAGVISGIFVFWLLSRYVPGMRVIGVNPTDKCRITVKNVGRANPIFRYPMASAVQVHAELHIVSSISSSDPAYSRLIPLYRDNPLIIKYQRDFVFVTRQSPQKIRDYVKAVEVQWSNEKRYVENLGIRFRLFSRDGFSNASDVAVMNWDVDSFCGITSH